MKIYQLNKGSVVCKILNIIKVSQFNFNYDKALEGRVHIYNWDYCDAIWSGWDLFDARYYTVPLRYS